jgi:hypothetical protein
MLSINSILDTNYYELINNHWKNLEIKFSPDVYRPEEETNLSRRVQGDN